MKYWALILLFLMALTVAATACTVDIERHSDFENADSPLFDVPVNYVDSADDEEITITDLNSERALFLKMNYLRARAEELRQAIKADAKSYDWDRKIEFFVLLRSAREVRNQIFMRNFKLVIMLARQWRIPGYDEEDIISEGNLKMLDLIDRYDLEHGIPFGTYAGGYIQQNFKKLTARAYAKQRLRPISIDAEEVVMPAKDAGAEFHDERESREIKVVATMLIDRLTKERFRHVIRLRFGLDGREPLTLQEIGDQTKITKEAVRQTERKALTELRLIAETLNLAL